MSALRGLAVAVVGYGNQGRAHALNLRDSGVDVRVGQRPGRSADQALADGFAVHPISEAVTRASVVMLTLPDGPMPTIFAAQVAPFLEAGATVMFAHGLNIVFGRLTVPESCDVAMVSPKGAGYGVRAEFESGRGVPALIAVERDVTGQAWPRTEAYAAALGCARSLVLRTTFREETVTDLFGEQTVLCGGIPALILAGFNTLVEAGYSPEVAYFECLHETKLIVDLLVARGISGMMESISDTAAWGGLTVGPRVISDEVKAKMRDALSDIESGRFAREWSAEVESGLSEFKLLRAQARETPLEFVGRALRQQL